MKFEKIVEIIAYMSGTAIILIIIFVQIYVVKNKGIIDHSQNAAIIAQNDEITAINLCVVEKKIESKDLIGVLNEYYLVLSNDMSIYVSKDDFNKYEVSRCYDFKIVERSTVTQWLEAEN